MKTVRIIRRSARVRPSKVMPRKTKRRTASGGFSRPVRDSEAMRRDLKRMRPTVRRAVGGELKLSGLVPELKAGLLAELRHQARLAEERDSANRVVKLTAGPGGVTVLTAQAHLAVALGKHVHASHKGGTLEIIWPKGDEIARVTWIAG